MLDWIGDNSAVVTAATNLVMASIWAAYLQLFYSNVRRQTRPMIVIGRAMGAGLDGHCLVSNMSAEAIYITCIVAEAEAGGRKAVCSITDGEDSSERMITRQGPLPSGGYMDIGSFERIVQRARGSSDASPAGGSDAGDGTSDPASPDAIDVTVVASYASSRSLVGAVRRFERAGDGDRLRPTTMETDQLRGFLVRRRLRKLVRDVP